MDGKHLAFADSSFDAVVAQYVITAVPDPEATLDDFIRVLKPGGELILVNHIGAESRPPRVFELAFAPLARRPGRRPQLPRARLAAPAAHAGGRRPTQRRARAPVSSCPREQRPASGPNRWGINWPGRTGCCAHLQASTPRCARRPPTQATRR